MALPDYSRGSGFYNPGATYRTPAQGSMGSIEGTGLYPIYGTEEDPRSVFNKKLAKLGLMGTDQRSQAAQGLFEESQKGYGMAKLSNMELMYPEYLDQVNLQKTIRSLSFEDQGIRSEPRGYRWGMRGQ